MSKTKPVAAFLRIEMKDGSGMIIPVKTLDVIAQPQYIEQRNLGIQATTDIGQREVAAFHWDLPKPFDMERIEFSRELYIPKNFWVGIDPLKMDKELEAIAHSLIEKRLKEFQSQWHGQMLEVASLQSDKEHLVKEVHKLEARLKSVQSECDAQRYYAGRSQDQVCEMEKERNAARSEAARYQSAAERGELVSKAKWNRWIAWARRWAKAKRWFVGEVAKVDAAMDWAADGVKSFFPLAVCLFIIAFSVAGGIYAFGQFLDFILWEVL